MSVRHLASFQYSQDAHHGDKISFESALQELPSQCEEVLEYWMWQTRDSSACRALHVPEAHDFHVIADATFKNPQAYLKYRDSVAHQAVCPAYRHILTARAALQCHPVDMIKTDDARAEGALVSVAIFLNLRDDVLDADVDAAIDQVRALGKIAASGARAVSVCRDLGIPTAEGQSPNHKLCLLAQFDEDDVDCIGYDGVARTIKPMDISAWEAASALHPILEGGLSSQPRVLFFAENAQVYQAEIMEMQPIDYGCNIL